MTPERRLILMRLVSELERLVGDADSSERDEPWFTWADTERLRVRAILILDGKKTEP